MCEQFGSDLCFFCSFPAQFSLRDCCARFLCTWAVHYGSDISVYGIGLQPNEIKEKLVDFLMSEVKIELFH